MKLYREHIIIINHIRRALWQFEIIEPVSIRGEDGRHLRTSFTPKYIGYAASPTKAATLAKEHIDEFIGGLPF